MIERLNFFDLYAYFLPGLILLGLLGAPYTGELASVGVAGAILWLSVAYVLGHVLYPLTSAVFPSGQLIDGQVRHFSDDLLSGGSVPGTVSKALKAKYEIDLAASPSCEDGPTPQAEAFRKCRDYLVHIERSKHAEQMQGMYTFLRGVAGACVLGVGYFSGWLIGLLGRGIADYSLGVGAFPAAGALAVLLGFVVTEAVVRDAKQSQRAEQLLFWGVGVVLVAVGIALCSSMGAGTPSASRLIGLVVLSAFVGAIAHDRSRYFAKEYARSIISSFEVAIVQENGHSSSPS